MRRIIPRISAGKLSKGEFGVAAFVLLPFGEMGSACIYLKQALRLTFFDGHLQHIGYYNRADVHPRDQHCGP